MRLPAAVTGLLLSACAVLPAGEDPKGQELKQRATPVLTALVSYRKDKGEYPSSLHELVPRYLKEVPFTVGLNLDLEHKVVTFIYSLSWSQAQVACVAPLGQMEWTCERL